LRGKAHSPCVQFLTRLCLRPTRYMEIVDHEAAMK
jgi:hypothetical protein